MVMMAGFRGDVRWKMCDGSAGVISTINKNE